MLSLSLSLSTYIRRKATTSSSVLPPVGALRAATISANSPGRSLSATTVELNLDAPPLLMEESSHKQDTVLLENCVTAFPELKLEIVVPDYLPQLVAKAYDTHRVRDLPDKLAGIVDTPAGVLQEPCNAVWVVHTPRDELVPEVVIARAVDEFDCLFDVLQLRKDEVERLSGLSHLPEN